MSQETGSEYMLTGPGIVEEMSPLLADRMVSRERMGVGGEQLFSVGAWHCHHQNGQIKKQMWVVRVCGLSKRISQREMDA